MFLLRVTCVLGRECETAGTFREWPVVKGLADLGTIRPLVLTGTYRYVWYCALEEGGG